MSRMILRNTVLIVLFVCCVTLQVTPVRAVQFQQSVISLPAESPSIMNISGKTSLQPSTWQPEPDKNWNVYHYANTGSIARAYGSPITIVSDLSNEKVLSDNSLEFVDRWSDKLGMAGCDLKVVSVQKALKWTIVTVEPIIGDIPVYDAWVILSINQFGAIASLKAQGFGSNRSGSFKLDEQTAIQLACESISTECKSTQAERVLLPRSDSNEEVTLRYAYQVSLNSVNPALQPVIYVDAETGAILAAENRVYFDELAGMIDGSYYPLYGAADPDTNIFVNEWVHLVDVDEDFTDEEGGFHFEIIQQDSSFMLNTELRGLWAEVHKWDEDIADIAEITSQEIEIHQPEEVVEVNWMDDNSRDDERNLYYHVNVIHDFWKDVEAEFDGMDYPILAVCGLGGEGLEGYEDNAFSSAQGIFFGRGRNYDNFALYADVIYHEYTHSVTSEVYGNHALPYEGESGAMNEAWSDYFPCSITDEPLMGEGGLMGANRYMRNLDNNLTYPDDIQDEVHADSRMISAAMWHSREVLGKDYCDSLFHFARYHYARDFSSYFQDILLTDDDDGDLTNGSPNYQILYEEFTRHGIGPGDPVHFVLREVVIEDEAEGNGNGLWEQGETIIIDAEVFRSADLIPTYNQRVRIMIETDYEGIEFVQNEVDLGQINVGEWASTPEPLLFRINEDAETGFASIFLTVYADRREQELYDTLRIPIGAPPLLIYRDGSQGKDYSSYYCEALDMMDIVYTQYNTAMEDQPLADQLALFDAIIWFTGDDREGILTESDREALASYLDGGGNLILSGQSLGDVDGTEEFFADYLGCRNVTDSLHQREVRGADDDPVGRGMRLLLSGQSAGNQERPGAVEAIEPAVEAFYYPREDGLPGAGVRYDNPESGARSVYLAFGLEGIHQLERTPFRAETITAMLEWFGTIETSVKGQILLPQDFSVGTPYPNPFNETVYLPFRLARTAQINATVFDLSGRIVISESGLFGAGENIIPLNAHNWSTGAYYISFSAGDAKELQRIVLVK
ncbi:T9SS type A sorting domain-containing protein [bacterium]|nr:T9SS type A sorting domain-containing protein [bacterium]